MVIITLNCWKNYVLIEKNKHKKLGLAHILIFRELVVKIC